MDSLSPPLAFHTSEIWLNLKQEFKSSVPIVKKGSMVWKLPGQAREGDLEWEVSHFKSASFLFIPHMLQSKKVKKIALFKILWFSIKKCIHEIYSELVF